MSDKYLLGIDNGGTVTKAAIFDTAGRQLACAAVRSEASYPQRGFAERSMSDIWATNCRAISSCIASSGISANSIVAVGVSGHGKGLYPLARSGKIFTNGILSADTRAAEYTKQWERDGTADRVFGKTFQRVLPCQPVALLRWIKNHAQDVYERTATVLFVKDFVRFMLTGEACTELTDISGSSLLNLRTKSYDSGILEEFGIADAADKLPEVKRSTDVCGFVTAAAAQATGLVVGTPVAGGMFDIDACAFGMGLIDDSDVCVIGGTWSINEYISRTPVTDKSVAMNSLYCIPQFYLAEECSPTSAGNLEWVLKMLFADQISACGGINNALFEAINQSVAATTIEDSDVVFLPFLYGSNEDGVLSAGLHNLTAATQRGQILRAVYEGITFSHKRHLDKLFSSRKTPPRRILLGGGVARSEVWARMFADVTGVAVCAAADCEQGCFGAALAAGIAVGVYDGFERAVQCVPQPRVFEPNKSNHRTYLQKYERYKQTLLAAKLCDGGE